MRDTEVRRRRAFAQRDANETARWNIESRLHVTQALITDSTR